MAIIPIEIETVQVRPRAPRATMAPFGTCTLCRYEGCVCAASVENEVLGEAAAALSANTLQRCTDILRGKPGQGHEYIQSKVVCGGGPNERNSVCWCLARVCCPDRLLGDAVADR